MIIHDSMPAFGLITPRSPSRDAASAVRCPFWLLRARCLRMVLASLCLLGAAAAATPAHAQGAAASFDCAKASSTAEQFICSEATLRWQDLALSRSYRAARDAVADTERNALVVSQRSWLRERDRRCIADRTIKELTAPAAELHQQAYECLRIVYLNRRRALDDLVAPPVPVHDVREIDLKPIAAARPELAERGGVAIAEIHLSPKGTLAAILPRSPEFDFPDQIWLYRVADGKLAPATPAPSRQQPRPDGSPVAIRSLAWLGETLYTRVAVWAPEGVGEEGTTVVYTATMDGNRQLDEDEVSDEIYDALSIAARPALVGQDELPESEWDRISIMQNNPDFIAWPEDLGDGTKELRLRKRTPGGPTYPVAWGGKELDHFLFDAGRSQLIYPADTGLVLFDLPTHASRRIAGTSRSDRPRAISDDLRLIAWSTRNACGDAFMAQQDEDLPEHFCLAHLQATALDTVPAGVAPDDPWVGEWERVEPGFVSARIRRGTAKPEYLVIDLVAGAPGCAGDVTLYGKPSGTTVLAESHDPEDIDAPVCKVKLSLNGGRLEAQEADSCTYYHGAACLFESSMERGR